MVFFGTTKHATDHPLVPSPGYGVVNSDDNDDDLPVATLVIAYPADSMPPALPEQISVPPASTMIPATPDQPNATTSISLVFRSRAPTLLQPCPYCQTNARTRVVTYPSCETWSLCIFLFILVGPFGWIPLFMSNVRKQMNFC